MEYLKELISFLNGNKIKQSTSMLPGSIRRSSKIYQLYEGILHEKIQSEADIAETFFPGTKYPDAYTNRLKRKLRDRLVNTLFLIDLNVPHYNDLQRAHVTCYKNLTAIQVLSARYKHKAATELAEKTLRQSLYYGFTEINLSIARYLSLLYSTSQKDRKRTQYYLNLVEEQAFIHSQELQAEKAYIEVGLINAYHMAATDEISQKAKKYAEKFWPLIHKIKTPKFNNYVFYLLIASYEKTADYQKMAEISQAAIDFFEKNQHLATISARSFFPISNIVALSALKQFAKAERIGKKTMNEVEKGSSPWFNIAHYMMTSYYRNENFQAAQKLLQQIKQNPNFKKLPGLSREYWRMHEAYIYFFSKTLSLDMDPKFSSNFRATTFLNQVPDASRDKEGLNTQLLVLQIMISLVQKKYDNIIQRTDALKTYTSKYLRKDQSFRGNCFIKMLIQLPKANFHRAGVERKAAPLYKRLTTESKDIVMDDADREFVPFEIIWKYILMNLDYKFHYG